MNIPSLSSLHFPSAVVRSSSARQTVAAAPANTADTSNISRAARDALAAEHSDSAVEARLAGIKARGAVNRSQEDHEFLFANDTRLAEISAKPFDSRTADEIDYMQKATGFVNTFAHLSSAEKALYDRAVASGNTDAAAGIAQIALIRQGGEMAGGAGGSTYNPRTTGITGTSVAQYFSHSIVDPTGNAAAKFQALLQFLARNPSV